ncbi:MAG: HEAT repeat domain-containing protein [Acidobacteriota bacterium]
MFKKRFIITVLNLSILIAIFSSCQKGEKKEGIVSKSEEAINKLYSEHPSYALYAVEVIKDVPSPFAVDLIHRALEGTNWDSKMAAIRAVRERKDRTAIPILKKIYSEGVEVDKVAAALSLARMGDEDVIPFLEEKAVEAGGVLNPEVIIFLTGRGNESFLPALKKKLESKSIDERNEVYILLGRIKKPWALDILKEAFKKEWGVNLREPIVAIGKVGGPSEAKLITPYINTQGLSLETMSALGSLKDEGTREELKKFLKHEKKYARLYSAAALWRMGEKNVNRVIEELMQDSDPAFKGEMAEQLSRVEDPNVLPYLGALASDPDEKVRKVALRNLKERMDPALIKILLDGINDTNYEAAVIAIDGVGKVGERDSIPQLEPLLSSENPYIVISAAAAIIEMAARHPLK